MTHCCKQLCLYSHRQHQIGQWDCNIAANCNKNSIFDPWKLAYQIPLSTNIWTCWLSKMVSWLVTLNICIYSIIKVLTFLERIVACQADWGYQMSCLSDCTPDMLILFSVLADWPAWKYLRKVCTCSFPHCSLALLMFIEASIWSWTAWPVQISHFTNKPTCSNND